MKLKTLSTAIILATVPMTGAWAAALERSNQSISAFLEPGNYFEAGFNVVDQNISGQLTTDPHSMIGRYSRNDRNNFSGSNVGEVGDTYLVPNLAIKTQLNEKFSIGLLYDEPFGINTTFENEPNHYFSNNGSMADGLAQAPGTTSINMDTKNISIPVGYHVNKNLTLYVAPVYQHLSGSAYLYGYHAQAGIRQNGIPTSYKFNNDEAYGWLTGVAYQNNDDSFKTSITYRSKIDHKFHSNNIVFYSNLLPDHESKQNVISTPESVNLNFSNKFKTNTITTLDIRWINWKDFNFNIAEFKANTNSTNNSAPSGQISAGANGPAIPNSAIGSPGGYDMIAYQKDQWSINAGVEQKLSDRWDITGSLGWDSGVGKYISHYTPINGSWNVGLGFKYKPASNYFVQTGVNYIKYDDVRGQHSKQVAEKMQKHDTNFKNNYALNYGFKVGYRF